MAMLIDNYRVQVWEMTHMDKASNRYHYNFDAKLYNAATKGKSIAYCNRLIDQAMAICGYPGYTFNRYARLSKKAISFLERFTSWQGEV